MALPQDPGRPGPIQRIKNSVKRNKDITLFVVAVAIVVLVMSYVL